jgi:hypothetical protein
LHISTRLRTAQRFGTCADICLLWVCTMTVIYIVCF